MRVIQKQHIEHERNKKTVLSPPDNWFNDGGKPFGMFVKCAFTVTLRPVENIFHQLFYQWIQEIIPKDLGKVSKRDQEAGWNISF